MTRSTATLRHLSLRPLAAAASLAAFAAGIAVAEDWPCFRGTNHDGISKESGFVKNWDKPVPMLWDREIGSGFSSFAVVDKRVYTCGEEEGQQVIFCLNADSGEVVWKLPFEKKYGDPQGGDGTRATPAVDDGRVYIVGGHGRMLCLDAKDGKIQWEKQFDSPPQWGYSGSVLIDGDMAIVSPGKSQGALVALDKKSGKEIWKCGDDPPGYATPYPFDFEGTRYIVGFMGDSAIIAEAGTGKQVMRTGWQTDWQVNAASPIYHDGHLFLTSGYQTGCALLKLTKSGDKLNHEEVWRSKVLMNKFQSPILHNGFLYSSDQKALVCAEFMTGREAWREHRLKHGTLIIADGSLLLLTEGGELQIAPADPSTYEPVTRANLLSGRCWTVSVLSDGKLYVRNLTRVACFDLKP
jgi:outer membrane protein assembly factor BamB